MKSLTRDEFIALAEKYALPDPAPKLRTTYEFTELDLLQFVSAILIKAAKEWGVAQ